jgi:hypothetical protein
VPFPLRHGGGVHFTTNTERKTMYVITIPGYATTGTQERLAEHNRRVDAFTADQAAVARLVKEAEAADPLTSDSTAAKETAIQRQREVMGREADLWRERIPLLRLLHADRNAALRAAEVELERVKQETIGGLQKLGFGQWLADANPIIANYRVLAIASAAPVAAALRRFDMLQDAFRNLLANENDASARIRVLTTQIESVGFSRGLRGFSERLLASGTAR